jgi:hypothetical protein
MRRDGSDRRGPRRPDFWKGLSAGLIGGAAGSLAMMGVQAAIARGAGLPIGPGEFDIAQDARARRRPDRSPDPAPVQAARRLSRRVLGRDVPESGEWAAGQAFHLGFGTAMGGAYGVLAEYAPIVGIGAGFPFGACQAMIADPIVAPALGMGEPIRRVSPWAYLGSVASHATYGVVTEVVRRRARRMR